MCGQEPHHTIYGGWSTMCRDYFFQVKKNKTSLDANVCKLHHVLLIIKQNRTEKKLIIINTMAKNYHYCEKQPLTQTRNTHTQTEHNHFSYFFICFFFIGKKQSYLHHYHQ